MPALPDGFVPLVRAYAIGAPDGIRRTEVSGGMPRYALEWDRGVQQYRVTLALTELQMSVWTAFFHHVIKKGALAFDMPLDSGFGTETHSAQMLPGSYAATRAGKLFIVSFVVEAESSAYAMSIADAQALVDLYGEYGVHLGALLRELDLFANQYTQVLQP